MTATMPGAGPSRTGQRRLQRARRGGGHRRAPSPAAGRTCWTGRHPPTGCRGSSATWPTPAPPRRPPGSSPSRPADCDGVVTAAGTDVPGRLADLPAETWERVVTVDLLATAAVVRAALPYLERSHGTVVTVASTLGVKAVSDATAYCAAKFGVVGFTRALAAELAGSVGVTLLVPGGMRTAFFDERTEQYRPGADAVLNDPASVAAAVLFALSQPPAARSASSWSAPSASRRTRDPGPARARRGRPGDRGAGAARPAGRRFRTGTRPALAAPAWLAPLVDLVGGVDQLVPTDGLDGVDWPGPAPHWAREPARARAAGRTGCCRRPSRSGSCAFHCPEADHSDGPRVARRRARGGPLVPAAGLVRRPRRPGRPGLLRPPAAHRVPVGVTVVHPGAKIAAQRWPPGRFAAVARS